MEEKYAKFEEFARIKHQSSTVIFGDILQKIVGQNLTLTIKFKLTPICYAFCSHLKAVLHFDGQRIKTFYASIPKTMKDLKRELSIEICTKITYTSTGEHKLKIEMNGVLPSGQTLGLVSSKEITIQLPKLEIPRQPLRKQIIVEKIRSESGIAIITPDVQKLFREMKELWKKELQALRQK